VSLPDAWARMDVHDLDMKDHFNVLNALFGGGPDPVPAVVSYDIRWHDKSGQSRVRNAKQDFAALVFDMDAQIEWQATSEGVTYASTGAAQEVPFAVIGRERNGKFFP